jgi:hypothetical protein
MAATDPERLLALLRDPNVESAEVAALAGVERQEAGRAARLVTTIARTTPEEVATLPGPLAAAVLRAAAAAGRIELVAALAARPEKEAAKEAKRLLHLLRTRGVAVPAPARPTPAPPAPVEPALAAYALTVDGFGERAVWLSRVVPGRGIEVAQAVLSDERGLLQLEVGLVGRKEWRTFVSGLLDRSGELGIGELDRAQALALVAAARAVNGPAGTRIPDGADHWLSQQGPAPALAPPGASLPRLEPDAEAAALAASGALHDLTLLRGWLPEESFLREVARRLDEAEATPLELSGEQRRARLAALVGEAVNEYFTGPRRERLATRLLDMAEHLQRSGSGAHADAAAAAARALQAGRSAAEIPFAARMVQKAFPGDTGAAPSTGAAPPSPPLIAPAR